MSPQPHPDRSHLPTAIAVLVGFGIAARLLAIDLVPSWLYVGPVTLDTLSLLTFLLGCVVVGDWLRRRVGGSSDGPASVATGSLGVLTVLTSAFAQVSLNTDAGGVFFAGIPALVLGSCLVAVVLVRSGYRLGRRVHTGDFGA